MIFQFQCLDCKQNHCNCFGCCRNRKQLGFSSMLVTAGTIVYTINFLMRWIDMECRQHIVQWSESFQYQHFLFPAKGSAFKVYQCVKTLTEFWGLLNSMVPLAVNWQCMAICNNYYHQKQCQHRKYIHAWNQSAIFCQWLHQEPISAYGLLVTWKEVYCIIKFNYASFNNDISFLIKATDKIVNFVASENGTQLWKLTICIDKNTYLSAIRA